MCSATLAVFIIQCWFLPSYFGHYNVYFSLCLQTYNAVWCQKGSEPDFFWFWNIIKCLVQKTFQFKRVSAVKTQSGYNNQQEEFISKVKVSFVVYLLIELCLYTSCLCSRYAYVHLLMYILFSNCRSED